MFWVDVTQKEGHLLESANRVGGYVGDGDAEAVAIGVTGGVDHDGELIAPDGSPPGGHADGA